MSSGSGCSKVTISHTEHPAATRKATRREVPKLSVRPNRLASL